MISDDGEREVSSIIGHWDFDVKTKHVFWSDETYAIHGIEPGTEVELEAAINMYHPDDRETVRRCLERAIGSRENYEFELRLIRSDGVERDVRSIGVVRKDDSGEVISIFGVFEDITEIKQRARELREKTQLLQQAEELGGIGHWVLRSNGSLYWSDEVYRIHGMEPGSPIDVDKAIEAYHPDDRGKVRRFVERALRDKEDYEFVLRLVKRSGEVVQVVSMGVVLTRKDGSVHSLFGVIKDVTNQKRLEARLRRAAKEADAGNRAKSEFLANMSHELRTPLNAVLGFAQMLELDQENTISPLQADCVGQIIRSGRHLLELIDKILDLAKIESGKVELTTRELDVMELVEECILMLDTNLEEKQITVRFDLKVSALPCVMGDRIRTRQILLNFLSNAIKYNRVGGEIVVSMERKGEKRLRVIVGDTGKGISEQMLPYLFEPFNRLGAENSEIDGTGIGLTLSRELVLKMGGKIGVESREGEGSAFWFELPIAQAKPKQRREPGNEESSKASATSPSDGKILYVEDNPESAELMKKIVSKLPGVRLTTLGSAEGVFDYLQSEKPNLIILDINLPGSNGIDVVRQLRTMPEYETAPIFALSAAATERDIKRGMEAGFDQYFTKPVKVAEIMNSIRSTMDGLS